MPTLDQLLPPDSYPILNACALIGILLTMAITLGLIILAVRDGHKRRRP